MNNVMPIICFYINLFVSTGESDIALWNNQTFFSRESVTVPTMLLEIFVEVTV